MADADFMCLLWKRNFVFDKKASMLYDKRNQVRLTAEDM